MTSTRAVGAFEHVFASSLADWRDWLACHHGQADSVWLVTWKKNHGPHVPYGEVRDAALCFGWIDSRPAKLDDGRTMLLMSPRRPGSLWSGVNKRRVADLTEAGLMTEPGLAAVERAKADGTWDAFNEADALHVPGDLAAALLARPPASERFHAFPASSRRGILEWVASAKRPETRLRRVQAVAEQAAEGIRANHPSKRGV